MRSPADEPLLAMMAKRLTGEHHMIRRIARRVNARVGSLIAVGFLLGTFLLGFVVSSPAQDSRPRISIKNTDRSEAVAQVLNRHLGGDFTHEVLWTLVPSFRKVGRLGSQSPYWLFDPNDWCGTDRDDKFDRKAFTLAAADLFAAYGVPLARNHRPKVEGVDGALDGWNATFGLGFHIVDEVNPDAAHETTDDPSPSGALDEHELQILDPESEHLFVISPSSLAESTGLPHVAMFQMLLNLSSFLDAHTSGEDMAVSILSVFERSSWSFTLEAAPSRPESRKSAERDVASSERTIHRTLLEPRRPAAHLIRADGTNTQTADAVGRNDDTSSPSSRPTLVSTAGTIQAMELTWPTQDDAVVASWHQNGAVYVVSQTDADGREHRVQCEHACFFLPSWFDAARPFTVESCFLDTVVPPNGVVITPGKWR